MLRWLLLNNPCCAQASARIPSHLNSTARPAPSGTGPATGNIGRTRSIRPPLTNCVLGTDCSNERLFYCSLSPERASAARVSGFIGGVALGGDVDRATAGGF